MALTLYAKNNLSPIPLQQMLEKFKKVLIIAILALVNNFCFAEKITTINFHEELQVKTKYHLLQVEILGLNKELKETIEKDLLIFHATNERKLTKTRIENLHDRTNQEIIANLQTLGYYHAKVTNASLREISNHRWLASYTVDLDKPTLIKDIDTKFTGEAVNNSKLSKKLKQLSTKFLYKNQQLRHEDYEKTKQFILNNLHEHGFLNAEFVISKIIINPKDYSATIAFMIDSKQQYYFGQVKFESDEFPEDFLKKYIPFKEQDLYLASSLMELKDNLLNSGLFSKVRIDTLDLSNVSNNIVPVIVRVYKKPNNNYNASLGYGTDTGIRGKLGYSHLRTSYPGHKFTANVIGSKIRREIMADYSLLGTNPVIDAYNFGITGADEHIQKRFNKNASIYVQKSKKLPNKQQFLKLNFLTEKFRIFPDEPIKNVNFLIPGLRLVWIHHKTNKSLDEETFDANSDQSIFGNKFDITTKISSKAIGSANILQITANNKLIQPLFYDFNFIFRGSIGTTRIKTLDQFPISLRFFAGGDYSVRGFAYESLGPIVFDKSGNPKVAGGKHLVLASFELEKPIYKQVGLAGFVDTGNALNTFNNFRINKLALGTGLGLIYRAPIGSLRAYVAQPVRVPNNINPKRLRIHLIFDAGLY